MANHGSRKNKEKSCFSCLHYRICFCPTLLMANLDKALACCREGEERAIANITVRAEGGTGGSRETREEWPQLTVETEVNGDSKRVQIKGVLPWLACWACRAGTRDFCPAFAVLVAQYKIFFPNRTLFPFICPHRSATWAGSRAGSPTCLLVYVS